MNRNPDARALALKVLDSLERKPAFADEILDAELAREPGLDPRDRGLASHLVYGVLRWQNRLDAHIAHVSSRPLEQIHPRLLRVLRIGAYQILFLDRVPDRAAVNEAVELARRSALGHASGFVNAVLRKVAACGPDLPLPSDPGERLALLFGCPRWLVELWIGEHCREGAEALCRAAARIPLLWLRTDPAKISRNEALQSLRRDGLRAGAGAHAPEAVWVESGGDPRAIPLVARKQAVVQDQASQLVGHLAAPEPGSRILDACAAPGLKATHLARLAGAGGCVTALEVRPERARMIEALAAATGCSGIRARVADAREFRSAEPFDLVLVDAPCSGLGVLSRNPEAKWRRTRADLQRFPPLQRDLLANAADLVRPGGVLVYATCTTVRSENEDVVEAFLAGRPDFVLESPPRGPVDWNGLATPQGYYRTFPARSLDEGAGALDGFFGARLRRRTGRA